MQIEDLLFKLFSQIITLNLRLKGLSRNHHRNDPILILLQSHQNMRNFVNSKLIKLLRINLELLHSHWEPWHHQIVNFTLH